MMGSHCLTLKHIQISKRTNYPDANQAGYHSNVSAINSSSRYHGNQARRKLEVLIAAAFYYMCFVGFQVQNEKCVVAQESDG